MIFILHIISVIPRYSLPTRGTDFQRHLRYRPVLESIGYGCIGGESISTPVQSDSNPGYMVASIHNEKRHLGPFAIPYEDEHGDTSHYPEALQLFSRHGSFSFVKASRKTRTSPGQIYRPHAEKRISHRASERHRSNRRSFWSGDAKVSAPSHPVVPTFDTVNHTVENEPRPKTRCRHRHSSAIGGLFFERLLNFRIGSRNHGARLSHPKSKLTEKPLALPNTQCHSKIPSNIGRQ